MDKDKAVLLFESLLDRIERNDETGKYRLEGAISAQEWEALEFIAKEMGLNFSVDSSPQQQSRSPSETRDNPEAQEYPLSLKSLEVSEPQNSDILMGLDFGTAMSKASATRGADETLLDLALGVRAGHNDAVYPVASSIFIHNDGTVFFGPQAINQSLTASQSGRRRFDSPKQILSQGSIHDLFQDRLEEEINPTDVPMTKGDMITLYLAYLTDLACTELEERHEVSRYVRRNFARPAWNDDRAEWAEEQLKNMLAQAQILADTFHNKWRNGLSIADLKAAVDTVHQQEELPTFLINEGILEALASGNSSLHDTREGSRQVFMVADIGAGTSDFALFVSVNRKNRDGVGAAKIKGTDKTLRQAGDTLDKLLHKFILEKEHKSVEDQHINAALSLRIRQYKEELFKNKELRYALADDTSGYITLGDFLNLEGVQAFADNLKDKFDESLQEIHGDTDTLRRLSDDGIHVILTGGGAVLPMAEELTEGSCKHGDLSIRLKRAQSTPEWIEEGYVQLVEEFPQLAVAIGTASEDLAEEKTEIDTLVLVTHPR